MKLLYIPCHSIAEYDEIKLFSEIGIEVFSTGSYFIPSKPVDPKRPPLNIKRHPEYEPLVGDNPEIIPKELVKNFDIVFFHWLPLRILNNWENLKDKKVILRTNGQSVSQNELQIRELKRRGVIVVRYSPKERNIPFYAGEDALIRFYKDPEEFKNWNGEKKRVISLCQSMLKRGPYCNASVFLKITEGFERKLFGPDNEELKEIWGGCLDYEQLKKELQDNRVYFYTGTMPASYTLNFIEAFMTGIPIVSIGKKLGNPFWDSNLDLFEIGDLIENGKEGFVSDDLTNLKGYIKILLDDYSLAKEISKNAREKAIELFGKEKIKRQWINFFKNL